MYRKRLLSGRLSSPTPPHTGGAETPPAPPATIRTRGYTAMTLPTALRFPTLCHNL